MDKTQAKVLLQPLVEEYRRQWCQENVVLDEKAQLLHLESLLLQAFILGVNKVMEDMN